MCFEYVRQLFNICFLTQEGNTIFKLYFSSVGKFFGKSVLYEALRQYRRETEGGRAFAVSATRLWNSTPIEIRKLDSVACFKKNMFAKIFKEQQYLHHFII